MTGLASCEVLKISFLICLNKDGIRLPKRLYGNAKLLKNTDLKPFLGSKS
ncbi:hypothetical protein E4N83_09230 [Treponema denticola]|jgi:hypothetical protein|nr:hypothetical protein [Treponema denticola]UTC85820.1 hypothetical protein E4N91_09340 [Treponema denticola]UTC98431.1 hypothetical protein E4N83_09230 [Treponema denticola]